MWLEMENGKNAECEFIGAYRLENEAWSRERCLYDQPLPECGASVSHRGINAVVLLADEHPNFASKAMSGEIVVAVRLEKSGCAVATTSMLSRTAGPRVVMTARTGSPTADRNAGFCSRARRVCSASPGSATHCR